MPCDTVLTQVEKRDALADLRKRLQSGDASVVIGREGGLAFKGWEGRRGMADVCAYRLLKIENSFAMQQAIHKAELLAGRKLNEQAVASGLHSHDDGKTWSKHK